MTAVICGVFNPFLLASINVRENFSENALRIAFQKMIPENIGTFCVVQVNDFSWYSYERQTIEHRLLMSLGGVAFSYQRTP